jgi:hypothetical protein
VTQRVRKRGLLDVRRSSEDGASETLAPQVQAVSDPVFGQEKAFKSFAEKEPLNVDVRRPYQNRHRCAGGKL